MCEAKQKRGNEAEKKIITWNMLNSPLQFHCLRDKRDRCSHFLHPDFPISSLVLQINRKYI